MAEYIERDVALLALSYYPIENPYPGDIIPAVLETARKEIARINAADVAPVRHGRWNERKSLHAESGIVAKCSACQKDVQYLGNPLKFCPNCGAKMDGDG